MRALEVQFVLPWKYWVLDDYESVELCILMVFDVWICSMIREVINGCGGVVGG